MTLMYAVYAVYTSQMASRSVWPYDAFSQKAQAYGKYYLTSDLNPRPPSEFCSEFQRTLSKKYKTPDESNSIGLRNWIRVGRKSVVAECINLDPMDRWNQAKIRRVDSIYPNLLFMNLARHSDTYEEFSVYELYTTLPTLSKKWVQMRNSTPEDIALKDPAEFGS